MARIPRIYRLLGSYPAIIFQDGDAALGFLCRLCSHWLTSAPYRRSVVQKGWLTQGGQDCPVRAWLFLAFGKWEGAGPQMPVSSLRAASQTPLGGISETTE